MQRTKRILAASALTFLLSLPASAGIMETTATSPAPATTTTTTTDAPPTTPPLCGIMETTYCGSQSGDGQSNTSVVQAALTLAQTVLALL